MIGPARDSCFCLAVFWVVLFIGGTFAESGGAQSLGPIRAVGPPLAGSSPIPVVGSGPSPKPVRFPWTMNQDHLQFKVPNVEVSQGGRNVLIHLFVERLNDKAAKELSWQSLFELQTKAGQSLRCSNDCGVDNGHGMQITTGMCPLPGRETRLLIYFNTSPSDFPVQIIFPDESRAAVPLR